MIRRPVNVYPVAEIQLKPEQKARVAIDGMLEAADWAVQDYTSTALDLRAGPRAPIPWT